MAITIHGRRATPAEVAAIIARNKREEERKAAADDDTMGAYFRDYREVKRIERAQRKEAGLRLIRESGLPFTLHNADTHVIIDRLWHVWPSTGRWREGDPNRPGRSGFGVAKLLNILKGDKNGNR